MKTKTTLAEIERLEQRLEKVSTKIDAALAEDRLFLTNIDRVTAHCTRVLKLMESSSETLVADQASSQSSKTTSSDTSHLRSVPNESTSSAESALESRQLFPSIPQKQGRSLSPVSSRPSTQKEFIRNLNSLREERLRTILGEMKERMEKRDHDSA
jgi:hypothetical protein